MKKILITAAFAFAIAAPFLFAGTQVKQKAAGYSIGGTASEAVGFHGAAPVAQRSGAAQTALTDSTGGSTANATLAAVTAPAALTDSTGGTAATTLAAITTFTPSVAWNGTDVFPSAADATAIAAAITLLKNDAAQFAASQAENRAAIVALTDAAAKSAKLINELRAALVEKGLITGS